MESGRWNHWKALSSFWLKELCIKEQTAIRYVCMKCKGSSQHLHLQSRDRKTIALLVVNRSIKALCCFSQFMFEHPQLLVVIKQVAQNRWSSQDVCIKLGKNSECVKKKSGLAWMGFKRMPSRSIHKHGRSVLFSFLSFFGFLEKTTQCEVLQRFCERLIAGNNHGWQSECQGALVVIEDRRELH